MNTRIAILPALVAIGLAAFSVARADELIGGFEGDLSAAPFGNWTHDIAEINGSDPNFGILSSAFVTDQSVTQGSQSLVVDHTLWQNGYQPYLVILGDSNLAEAITLSDGLSFDFTPISPDGEGSIAYRQVFLAFTTLGTDPNTDAFGKIQQDWIGTFDPNGVPLPETLTWDFDVTTFDDDNTMGVTEELTFQQWAQNALDQPDPNTDIFFNLMLIFQGRDLDPNGVTIPFLPFDPSTVKSAIDNVQLLGLDLLLSDFDGNNVVGGSDFLAWQRGFGTLSGALKEDGDANGDGAVDGSDLDIWESEYGSVAALSGLATGSSTAGAVPEPSTATLLVLATLGILGRRQRCDRGGRRRGIIKGPER